MPLTRAQALGSAPAPPGNPSSSPSIQTPSVVVPDPGDEPGETGGDLAAAIALLAKTLAAPRAEAAPTAHPTKLQEPDTFDGSNANKLRTFIFQCSLHFKDRANIFSNDLAKVTYALSFLTGSALGWFEPALFEGLTPPWISDWDMFRHKLETNFGPFDPVGEAEADIEILAMPEASRASTYFVEFNRLTSRLQWDDHALMHQAYKGLARRIKNEMVHHDKPLTLLGLRKLVQAIDSRYWERKAEITRENPHPNKADPKSEPKAARNPDTLSRAKVPESPRATPDLTGKLGKDGKLTPQERQRRLDNSLCLFCGRTGHIANECPKVQAVAARAQAAIAESPASLVEVEAKKD